MTLKEMYTQNPVYAPRSKTDKLFILPQGTAKMHGVLDDAIRFILENQCKIKHNWALFVDQFRNAPDDANNGWRSEYWGKMMRGAAFTYAYTQDEELYALMTETVNDLLTTEDELGRITSYSVEKEFNGWDIWGRKYVLLGLQYFMDVCRDDTLKEKIIGVMCRNVDYLIGKIGPANEGKTPITLTSAYWQGLNACSILEPVVRLYSITGKQKYLDFASYIVSTGGIENGNIYELAYEGKLYPYQYPVTKAYEMMSNFEGLIEYYRVTGIEKWRVAAINFGRLVMESDITLIGSAGCTHELFDHSSIKQVNTKNLIIMQETCVTVTWMKFITQILLLTGDPLLVDEVEKSAYNGLLGSVNTEHASLGGHAFAFDSYSPLLMATRARQLGGTQQMRNNTEVYGCCVAIGAAGTGHLPSIAVMGRSDGVAVNLYEAGEFNAVTPTGKKVQLSFATDYPYDGAVGVKVSLAKPERFTVALRIPAWSAKTTLSVCGKRVKAVPGTYAEITREWQKGDEIRLSFDMRVRIIDAPDDPDDKNAKLHQALVRGPIVLARDARLGEEIDSIVDFAVDKDGYAVVKDAPDAVKFPYHLSYAVKQKDGSRIHVVDYASAGKTWRRDSRMTAWMPTKDYWHFNEDRAVSFYLGNVGKYLCAVGDKVTLSEEKQMWKIEHVGCYVRLKHTSTGKYLAMIRKDDVCALTMLDGKTDCPAALEWSLTKAALNRRTLENRLFGLQLYYDRHSENLIAEKPFSEHFVFDTCIGREFALHN